MTGNARLLVELCAFGTVILAIVVFFAFFMPGRTW